MGRSVTPLTQQIVELEIYTAMMGVMDAAVVGLVVNGFNPTQYDDYADLFANRPVYDGYAVSGAVTYLQGGTNVNGQVEVPAETVQFVPSGTTTAAEIGGWFLRNGAGTNWFTYQQLPVPFPIGVTGLEQLAIDAIARFRIDGVVWRAQIQVVLLETLTAAMGDLDGNLVKLYQAGYNPTELSTIAELDANECDFTGYMSQAIADWNEAGTDDEGLVVIVADTLQFLATGTGVANEVGGYYVTSADGLTLKFVVPLDAPFPMGVTGFEQLPVQATKTFGM